MSEEILEEHVRQAYIKYDENLKVLGRAIDTEKDNRDEEDAKGCGYAIWITISVSTTWGE